MDFNGLLAGIINRSDSKICDPKGARGLKKHLKRLNAPKHWMLDKLGGAFNVTNEWAGEDSFYYSLNDKQLEKVHEYNFDHPGKDYVEARKTEHRKEEKEHENYLIRKLMCPSAKWASKAAKHENNKQNHIKGCLQCLLKTGVYTSTRKNVYKFL
ncbi:hypothetical protein HYC85_006428 [Camellia sinensis]|uniref:Small ribosomal subunit protein eS4 N-terminal domain-containing protein n=1 Tax=Camellia sinensis TaxID=4442 RepID=A0A7J7HKZ1_CAMSI|nr:hypothetical protein HYC85_006428 [Camellia sinensis]